jgi:hypothetical protein
MLIQKTKFSLLLVFIVLVVGCERLDVIENNYADMADAISSGAVAAGRIPDFLPPQARDIKEVHNVDTHEVWVRFLIGHDGEEEIKEVCVLLDYQDVSFPRKVVRWWPSDLTVARELSKEEAEYTFYACDRNSFMATRDSGYVNLTAYYWM